MHKKQCFNTQISLCPGYCCQKHISYTKSDLQVYQNNINNIIKVLQGNNKIILKNLYKDIEKAVNNQEFEKANLIKKQILALDNIFKHQSILNVNYEKIHIEAIQELSTLFESKVTIKNIEMYDVSNIAGQFATASLVFFTDGNPNKKEYKKFKIKYTELKPNDLLMLKEVFNRRINNIH